MSEFPEFNLVRDPWLPVTTLDGSSEEWGVREFFHRAHEARGLNEPSPLAYTVILRFLLAIAHRTIQGPATDDAWYELWQQREQGFDPVWFDAYLDRWQHRFSLFDPVAPFGQVTDFAVSDKRHPAGRLLPEVASISNTTLFDHNRDDLGVALTPEAAARSLLVAHQYGFAGTGGTGGNFSNSPMIAGYAVSFEGETLYETMVLNLVLYGIGTPPALGIDDDCPFWELDEINVPNNDERAAKGLTDLYTFRSRRIRLLPNPDGLVSQVNYDRGLALDRVSETLRDPFKRYLAQKKDGPRLPRNFFENRALWRDVDGIIEFATVSSADNEPPLVVSNLQDRIQDDDLADLVPKVIATGLVNNQARISLWRMDRMAMPLTILSDEDRRYTLKEAIRYAESAWGDALRPAARWFANIGLAGDGGNADSGDIAAILTRIAIEQRYWSRIDREFQQFVTNLSALEDSTEALATWKDQLRRLCESCFRDASLTMYGDRWYQAQCTGSNYLYSQLKKVGLVEQREEIAV